MSEGQRPPGGGPPPPRRTMAGPGAVPPRPAAPSQPPPHAPPPHAAPPAQPTPMYQPPQPSGPYMQGPEAQTAPHAFHHQPSGPTPAAPPAAPAYVPPSPLEEGAKFLAKLKFSARRAFRLRIEPHEVLPAERSALHAATPPILDLNLQAFLAWRRSVLFLVACALTPLSIIGLADAVAGTMPAPIRFVRLAPAIAEATFCFICWRQLKNWAQWRRQRRWLFWGWLLFMLSPFVVFVYPLRTVLLDTVHRPVETLAALGLGGTYKRAVMPFVFAMIAMLQLAPKAISLMPGLIRSSLVIKLLFPGSTAPGWLIVMCAPLYALLAYVILIIPYQFTGSLWFIGGVLGVIAGQAILARAGFALAQPLTEEEALRHIKKVRLYYVTVMLISAALIVVALGSLVSQFNLRVADVITAVLKFESNVLILTMIGADLVITNLDRARSQSVDRRHVEEHAEVKIAAFVSLAPPPGGPPR
ncbi:MAG TPA: hypothetical protein VMZ28_09825 [Kofleriaceae bacterium]|nr:hypothetical protein [Kofleriaceae bacterium]